MANVLVEIAYVSKSCKAVQDAESKAWYHCKTAIFEGIPTGTTVNLTLDDDNKIVGGEIVGGPSVKPAKAPKADKPVKAPVAPTVTPAAQLATTTETAQSTVCPFCAIERHNSHYSVKQIRRECAERQFLRETATVVDDALPQSVMQYALWLAEAPHTVFAATVKGSEVIGGPAPTPPVTNAAMIQAAASEPSKPASKPATLQGGRKATKAADKQIVAAGEQMVAASPAGTWDGLLVKHAKNTVGLFQFVTASDMPGAKAHGNWIGATDPTVIANVVKAEPNDRVRVTLNDKSLVTAFAILGTLAADTGLTRGVEGSGKQAPAAPRGQKADKIVKAGKTARQSAARAEKAADEATAAANRAATAAPTATLKGNVKGTNTPAKAARLTAMSDAEIDTALKNSGQKSKAKLAGARKVKSTSKAVTFGCSGTSTHRNTCFGRCLSN